MQRNVRLVADHPTVVTRRECKTHRRRASRSRVRRPSQRWHKPGDHHADVFHLATGWRPSLCQRAPTTSSRVRRSRARSSCRRSGPARTCPSRSPRLVRILEALEDDVARQFVITVFARTHICISHVLFRPQSPPARSDLPCSVARSRNRSGRLRSVFCSAQRRRHLRISSWFPFISTSGTCMPRNSAGRV